MMTKHYSSLLRIFTLLTFCFWNLLSYGQHGSSSDANKKIVTKYFTEVVNTQKLNPMGEFFWQDYIWHQMDGKDITSSQDSSHLTMLRFIYKAIPDIQYRIDNIVAEGDMVAVNTTVRGTAKGEFFGLAASQKNVRFKQMFFFRLMGSKIKEEWEVVDVDGLIKQLSKP